jgi:uncharacterized protein YndB with AHSA1/START domain
MPSRLTCERTVTIDAPPERVLAAFFEPRDLVKWWQVERSVTVPRSLGAYALEWKTTTFADDVLGPLGGVFHGSVIEYEPAIAFLVADAYWQPPIGEPIGPMALEVRCKPSRGGLATELTVRQSGENAGVRWSRYFMIVTAGWERALADLKMHLAAHR